MQDKQKNTHPSSRGCSSYKPPTTASTTPPAEVIHLDSLQLARRLNISVKSLCRMRQEGTGPRFLRIGAKVVYRLEDVLEYEQSRLYDAVNVPVAQGGQL